MTKKNAILYGRFYNLLRQGEAKTISLAREEVL